MTPAWTRHVMWWHVYPLGFVGAPIRDADPDAPVVHRLERIEPWLDHVVELGLNGLQLGPVFASATHGYDTLDHFRIDPRLGDDADFDRLVAAAHERGIRVLLDGVFNHVGRDHPRFQAAVAGDDDARALFRWAPDGSPEVFEGHDALVALDHSSPQTRDLVVDVMRHWLDRGVDGWRLDAAYTVPTEFWADVLPRVRDGHPDAWIVGEVIHGDYAEIVAASGMDSVTQYELWQGTWHAIADRNLWELAHAIERHASLMQAFVPATFVGNHDVTRIATAVGAEFAPHALAVLTSVGGVPAIYAGDEFGWTATKEEREGGDDAVRPEFPTHPGAAARDERVLQAHHALLAARRDAPWLHEASTDVVEVTNTAIVLRSGTADAARVCAINVADEPVDLPAADATRVVAGTGELRDRRIVLPPHGWAVAAS